MLPDLLYYKLSFIGALIYLFGLYVIVLEVQTKITKTTKNQGY